MSISSRFQLHLIAFLFFVTLLLPEFLIAKEAIEASRKTLFLIGDSTVRNGSGKGDQGQWGWGQVLQQHFDHERLMIENRALGGRSSRTFLTEGRWERVVEQLKPGDYVLMQFGHNDGGQMFEGDRPRASIKGNGDGSAEGIVESTGQPETVRSFGWYLRKYINEAKSKGAVPIVVSLVPRDRWEDRKVIRANHDYGMWARVAAESEDACFIDLNDLVAARYEKAGQTLVHEQYFTPADHTHTSRQGAEVNAECVVKGIRGLVDCDLKDYLLPPKETTYLLNSNGCLTSSSSFQYSVPLREGNYRVTATLGNPKSASRTNVECELRRKMHDEVTTGPGQHQTIQFLVNTRSPILPHGKQVKLKPREIEHETKAWDNWLTLTFHGENPSLMKLEVLPATDSTTLFLLGDSTVADQYGSPWASWGQKLPRYFGDQIAVANHSESGETIADSWSRGRCEKIFESLKPGDWVMVQFGHNDMKSKKPGALDRYKSDLSKFIKKIRELGGKPVLVTSMEREKGIDQDTLGEYPRTMRDLATEQKVPLIDLHARSRKLYQELGDRLPEAFMDGTHHTNYGADLLAACIVEGIRDKLPELASKLNDAELVKP